MKRVLSILVLAALLGVGCTSSPVPSSSERGCAGKCDDAQDLDQRFEVDMARANEQWPGETPAQTPEDLMRVTVRLGGQEIVADTHLFGTDVNVIPYHNDDNVTDADGNPVERGDAIISSYFPPGEIGIAVKHHRPEHRTLSLEPGASSEDMKEDFKLQDTHIELVVGVERDGQPGVVTLNNPQNYEEGRFGEPDYPMIFLRPSYPEYLDEAQRGMFRDNIRTMMAGFNAVSDFPGDYNGGDPLAARDPEQVRHHTAQMIRAIAGDEEARAWFEAPENLIYCAELAHVAMSAGLIVPLNAETVVPMVGEDVWNAFSTQIDNHMAGEPSAFTELNENHFAVYVDLTTASPDLRPAAEYAPAGSDDYTRLAYQPMTMADIVESFMETHMPRSVLGEGLAPLQAAALQAMQPGLLEAMTLDQVPLVTEEGIAAAPADQQAPLMARFQVEQLFSAIVGVVGTSYDNYDTFRAALAPLMGQARAVTGPRDGSGNGLFVPPSTMHLVAQGRHPGGVILGLRYVGHGFHWSMVRAAGTSSEPEPEDPGVEDPEPEPSSGVLLDRNGVLASGETVRFTVDVPEGTRELRVHMDTEGDPDLYVQRGAEPTVDDFACRPYEGAGASETCNFTNPGSDAQFHVMVRGYRDGATYFLKVEAR